MTRSNQPAAAGHRRRCRATTDRRITKAATEMSSSAPGVEAEELRSSRRSAKTRSSRGLAGSTICSAVQGRVVNPDSLVGTPAAVRPTTAPSATTPSSTASATAAPVERFGRMVAMLASTLPMGWRQSTAPQGRVARRMQVLHGSPLVPGRRSKVAPVGPCPLIRGGPGLQSIGTGEASVAVLRPVHLALVDDQSNEVPGARYPSPALQRCRPGRPSR